MPSDLLSATGLPRAVKTALASGKLTKLADGNNLYLWVRPTGSASWVLDYRLHGKRKPYTLGTYPTVALAEARRLARAARELVSQGIDPVAQRKALTAQTTGSTVREIVIAWLEENAARWSKRHLSDYQQALFANVLPALGSKPLATVTEADLRAVLEAIEGRDATYMVGRVHSILKRVWRVAYMRRVIETNPMERITRDMYRDHRHGHFAALKDPHEVSVLIRTIRTARPSLPVLGLQFLTLTFVRPENVRFARWEQIDFTERVWSIPDDEMKMERAHLVPLARQAMELLQNLQVLVPHAPDDLVFPGRGSALSENTLNHNLWQLGFKERHTAHGFRAMAQTLLEEGGWRDKVVDKQLAHEEQGKVRRAYNRAEYWEERVRMMQGWADYLDALTAAAPKAAPLPFVWFPKWRTDTESDASH